MQQYKTNIRHLLNIDNTYNEEQKEKKIKVQLGI